MVDSIISRAKVMLFDEINNILTEKLSKNFHFVTICKDFGLKYNKMKQTAFITKEK
jgi:hypothetical protein